MALSDGLKAAINTDKIKEACLLSSLKSEWESLFNISWLSIYNDALGSLLTAEDAAWFYANRLIIRNDLAVPFTFKIGEQSIALQPTKCYALRPGEADLLYSQVVAAGYSAASFSAQGQAQFQVAGVAVVFSLG